MTAEQTTQESIPLIQKLVAVLWPSFLVAGLATIIFFTAFDPVAIMECNGYEVPTRMGAYTVGFFLFWLLNGTACLISMYFGRPCPVPERRQ